MTTARVRRCPIRNCLLAVLWSLLLLAPLALAHGGSDEVDVESAGGAVGCASPEPAESSLDQPYADFSGKVIAQVRFNQIDVFDPDDPVEGQNLYQFFNRLRVNTRQTVIAQRLLFAVGDKVDSEQIAETERILRAEPYLGNAYIAVDEVCGDEVALVVVTREIWTTEPRVSFSREGGDTRTSIGIKESNIAGSGNEFSIIYRDDAQRNSVSYNFYSPHLFNTQIVTELSYSDNSDGESNRFVLERPFYSRYTRWTAGIRNERITAIEEIDHYGEQINAYRHATEHRESFVGRSILTGDDRIHRFLAGFAQERHSFSESVDTKQGVPDDENLVYPWWEYRFIENQYSIYQNLYQLHRVEDVAMGPELSVRLGYGGTYFGNDSDVLRYQIEFSDMYSVSEEQLLQLSLLADGRYYSSGGQANEQVLGGQLSYFFLAGRQHRWYASVSYHQGRHLAQHNELTLGGDRGLRGYPRDYQRGERRYLINLEKRYVSDLHLFNLFRVGALVFFDAGRAWGPKYDDVRHLSNVGAGLRLSSSKTHLGSVVHVDLAYPLADKKAASGYQLLMQATRSF